MSSVDGARSIQVASDETVLKVCGPCKYNGTEKDASMFCIDCQECLCTACTELHKGLKFSRNHSLRLVKEMTSEQTASHILSCIEFCDCVQHSAVTVYCVDHDDVMCQICKTVKHLKCNTLTISEKSSSYSEIKLGLNIEKVVKLKKEIEILMNDRHADLQRLESMKEKCKDDINIFRQEFNNFLDELEDKMLKELENTVLLETKELNRHISSYVTTKQSLETDEKFLGDAKRTSEKGDMFAAALKVSHRLEDYEKLLQDICQDSKSTSIVFKRNEQLLDIQKKVKELGNLTVDYIKPHKPKNTDILFTDLKAGSSNQINIWMPSDRSCSGIKGCAVWPNGEILLCDCNNRNIKLLSDSFTIKESLTLKSSPWGVSVINSSSAVITMPGLKQLQYILVVPALTTGRVIQLDKECWGVAVINDEIYITCHSRPGQGEVRILDMDGKLKRKVGVEQDGSFLFTGPYYLTVSKTSGKIYVSDYNTATVTCMLQNGSVVSQYTDPDLVRPEDVSVDTEDNIMVCGGGLNVHVIWADGTKSYVLLTSKDGIQSPYSIAFRHTDDTLIIGCNNVDTLSTYEVKHNA